MRERDGGNDRERRKSILVSEGEVRRIIGCIIFVKINTCLFIYNASFFNGLFLKYIFCYAHRKWIHFHPETLMLHLTVYRSKVAAWLCDTIALKCKPVHSQPFVIFPLTNSLFTLSFSPELCRLK